MKRITAMLLLILLLFSGCGVSQPQSEKDTRTICVILKAMDSVHWMAVENGLKQAASIYGVSVNILYPASESDAQAQKVMIQNAIASRPDAIAVAPCDSTDMEMLEQAEQNGIQVFYIDTGSDQYKYPYIGSDNEKIGQMAARELASALDSGEIAIITGSLLQHTHAERVRGFQNYIQQNTDLEICTVKENPSSGDVESMQSMQSILKEYPTVKAVFCTSSMMVLGALQERNKEEKYDDILLVGVDTQSDALLAVEQGDILAIIGQNGYQIGYQTIKTIALSLSGQEIKDKVLIENDLITQENVEKYLSDYGK